MASSYEVVYCGPYQHLSQLLFLQRSQILAMKLFSLTPPDHRSRSSPRPKSGHGRTLQLRRSTRPFRSSRAHMQAWGWLQRPSHQINEHIRTAVTDTGCEALLEEPDSHEAMTSAQTASLTHCLAIRAARAWVTHRLGNDSDLAHTCAQSYRLANAIKAGAAVSVEDPKRTKYSSFSERVLHPIAQRCMAPSVRRPCHSWRASPR